MFRGTVKKARCFLQREMTRLAHRLRYIAVQANVRFPMNCASRWGVIETSKMTLSGHFSHSRRHVPTTLSFWYGLGTNALPETRRAGSISLPDV